MLLKTVKEFSSESPFHFGEYFGVEVPKRFESLGNYPTKEEEISFYEEVLKEQKDNWFIIYNDSTLIYSFYKVK